MSVTIQNDPLLLREDSTGGWRIGETRVLVELVLRAFQDGATPEAIAQRYPSLGLADVYAVVAYYLRHQDEMQSYLAKRELHAEETRKQIDTSQGDLAEVRSRLLAERGK